MSAAPRNRLQIFLILLIILSLPLSLLITACCLFSDYLRYMFMFYLAWIMVDTAPESGGRRRHFFRANSLWLIVRDFFPVELHGSKLDPSRNYVFGYHPHGVIGVGFLLNFGTTVGEETLGVKIFPMTLNLCLRVPIWREFLLALGFCSVSKQSCHSVLKHGHGKAICIIPGGAQESIDTQVGTNRLTLRKRKGFIRVALTHGADLVPIFSFGENDVIQHCYHKTLNSLQQKALRVFGFAPLIPYGKSIFKRSGAPYCRIVTVVGDPIVVPKKYDAPSAELIHEYHQKYMKALQNLYNHHKDRFSPERIEDMTFVR